jgi:hypothetical protein
LGTLATTGLLYQPQMIGDGDCGVNWWNEDWQGKPNDSEKTCRFVHHKSHMTRPGFEPRPPQWEASD